MSQASQAERERELVGAAVARLRAGILAIVFGMLGGCGLFLATIWLVVRGGPRVGFHLGLLANYFPGYTVSWGGSLVGLAYGALTGAVLGGSVGWLYNRIVEARRVD